MKKLLSLLSVLTISGSAMPTVIAASPYQKQENKSETLIRVKRQYDKIRLDNIFNEIGKVKKAKHGWFFTVIWYHSYYFLRLTPIFWKEIINLYYKENRDDFSSKVKKKIENEFNEFLDNEKEYITINGLGSWIYDNWTSIDYRWENSDKTKRIEINFTIKEEHESPTSQQILIASWHDDPAAVDPLRTWLVATFESFYIVPDVDDFYWISEGIKEEILVTKDYFGTNLIDLGIIDDENDQTILNAFIKKYPNLKISELEVVMKNKYSHITKNSSAKIKIKSESNNNYPKIILRPKLLFVSKIKLKELSDEIEKDKNFILLKNDLKDYWNNLPKKLEKLENDNIKSLFLEQEKEIIKGYIRDFNQITTLIEHKWKIDGLQNSTIQELKKFKNDINDLKQQIELINNKIINDTSISSQKIINKFKEILNRNSTKIIILDFPIIWHLGITGVLLFEAAELIFNYCSYIFNYSSDNEKNKNNEEQKPIDWECHKSLYSNLINKKYLDMFQLLLNIQYDVHGDGSCLFWSVATAYLLPVRNNDEQFRARFIQLFGEKKLINLSLIKKLLQQFNLENNRDLNQLWYQNQTAINLVTNVFRNRVVDYIQSNLNIIPVPDSELTFRDLIKENNEIDDNYLKRMRDSNSWGGTPEIIAMSNVLNINISVNNNDSYQTANQDSNNTINLFHVNNGTHYNFGLENQNTTGINTKYQLPSNISNLQNKKGGGQSKPIDVNNFILLPLNQQQLKNNEYHFLNQETEQNSLNNDENLEIRIIKNENKIVEKYNSLSKEEKQEKLNEINQHYQTLSQNEQKAFKEKLSAIGTATIGAGISVVGTKITVSGSTVSTSVAGTEAIEMTPLLLEGDLAAAETLSVAEGTTVVVTEGAVIGAEAGTAAALAPETLGLSLVIGGLAIAGTAIIWWLSSHDNNTQAVKHESHNQYNELEKYYKFLAHDQLKLDININEWNKIKQIYQENANNYQEFKNKIKSEITNFHNEDHSGWGGSITDEDINTLINILYNHFQEINNHFLSNPNHGWKIITNTVGSYFIIEEE